MAVISTDHDRKLRNQMGLQDIAASCRSSLSCRANDVDADVQRRAEAATKRLGEAGTQLWAIYLRDADNIYYGGQVLETTEKMIARAMW